MAHSTEPRMKSLLGTHILMENGIAGTFNTAIELGCTCMQIFTHSNRQWAFTLPKSAVVDAFLEAKEHALKLGMRQVVSHASYLINISSPDTITRKKSRELLQKELECCELLDIPYLVLHPGSRLGASVEEGAKNCAAELSWALEKVSGRTMILLENMAGQGTTMCSNLEELSLIYQHSEHKNRVGFCIDTCHLHAAGYDITTTQKYTAFWKQFDAILGLKKLHVIHMNDSLKPLGSHADRHTHIGQGTLTEHPFKLIMQDKNFVDIAKILETPKGDNLMADKINLSLLQSFLRGM